MHNYKKTPGDGMTGLQYFRILYNVLAIRAILLKFT